MKIGKTQLVDAVAGVTSGSSGDPLTKADIGNVTDAVFEQIGFALKEAGDEVSIPGFGKFVLVHKPARNMTNPATGEAMTTTPKNAVSFKPASALKELVA